MSGVACVVAKIVKIEIRDALLSLALKGIAGFEGVSWKGLLDKSEASSGLSPESAERTVAYKRDASLARKSLVV